MFEQVLVLNLDRRPDRLASVAAQARRHGILFERFPAVDGRTPAVEAAWRAYAASELAEPPLSGRPVRSYREFYLGYESQEARVAFMERTLGRKAIVSPGAWGLFESQIAILLRAIEQGWESLLVLEDDVLLHKRTPELFARFMAQAPRDWLIVQLGALQMHWGESWISWHSENLYRCNGSSIGAHAVGMRREAFGPLLREAERRDLPYDIGPLPAIKRKFAARCLTMWPNLAIQDASDSEIGSSTVFFHEARKEHNIYRWNLPDYGPAAEPARLRAGATPAVEEGEQSRVVNGRPWRVGNLGKLLTYARAVSRDPRPTGLAGTLERGAPAANGNGVDPGGPSTPVAPAAPSASPRSNEPPLVPLVKERPGARAILVAVFGLGPAELGRVVELVDGQCATAGVVPIFLTDGDDFQPFRSRRLPFEYLPPPSDGARFAPDLDWDLYRQRRLALLRRKWQPVRIVAFGPTASEALAAWRDSPFEGPDIADVVVTGNGPAAGVW